MLYFFKTIARKSSFIEFQFAHFERKLPSAITFHDCVNFFEVLAGDVLGIGDKVCKSNDELNLNETKVLIFMYEGRVTAEIYGALLHIYFRNDNWESFLEQVRLTEHMRYCTIMCLCHAVVVKIM